MLQGLSNATYGAVAKCIGSVLGSFDVVQAVFLRRSLAMGEVSFGRSDIDLTIVLRDPLVTSEDAKRVLALNRGCRLLRGVVPVLGEIEVCTLDELDRSYRADPYRCSLDRRMAVFVYGEPVALPCVPVEQKDALHWLVIWFAYYLPWALRRGDRRNLRKFALEMWNAYATATGHVSEPLLTRREVETAWREVAGPSFPGDLGKDVARTFGECCRIVARLYQELGRPFEPMLEPVIAPRGRAHFVVIPSHDYPPPPEAFVAGSLVGTPAVFDLFIQHINPWLYAELPQQLLKLGLSRPSYRQFVDYCRRLCSDPRILRRPGFVGDRASAAYTVKMFASAKETLAYLREGRTPLAVAPGKSKELFDRPPSYAEYYLSWYPRLYKEAVEVWRQLDAC